MERCFACNKLIKNSPPYFTARVESETTIVYVGPDCHKRIANSGGEGYQPPTGGPRLYSS